jgi:hypothetical protein
LSKPPKIIPKPLAIRTVELVRALQIIKDAIDGARKGGIHNLIPLAGQLRALLTEKSKGADPLLLRLAETFAQPLEFYVMPGADDPNFPDSLKEKLGSGP